MKTLFSRAVLLGGSACVPLFAQAPLFRSVDEVLTSYTQALGGSGAIDRITTREVHGTAHHTSLTYYWQKPDKVLMIAKHERIGFDGGRGWIVARRRPLKRLARGGERHLEIDANPLRYARLKELYSELAPAPPETLDARTMDLLVAPNNLGATKFFFDTGTHLLRRIEETGETSAYYKTSTDFLNYTRVNALQFPFRIVHSTTEPGGFKEDFRVSKVINNVELNPAIFSKR
jgi:hypothetical protein